MTPEISTRLAAASPRPENASIVGSRPALPANSPGPRRLCAVPPGGEPPSFLDSNPSDPMTPDPTHHLRPVSERDGAGTRVHPWLAMMTLRESREPKITLPVAAHR